MVQNVNAGYLPLWNNHDPRLPPLGRVVDARIVNENDGHASVWGTIEVFEAGEAFPFDTKRTMLQREPPADEILISFDRSYRDAKSQALLADLGALLRTRPQAEAKKALEPLSVLGIVGVFLLGQISIGFLGKVGTDVYDQVIKKLGLLFGRRRADGEPYVFRFVALVPSRNSFVEVELFANDPTTESMHRLFAEHLARADGYMMQYVPDHPEIQRVVFDASGPDLIFSFAVRSDCVPYFRGPTGA